MTTGNSRLAAQVRALSTLPIGELSEVFGSWVQPAQRPGEGFRERLLGVSQTFWLFLSQVLSADKSCRETVCKWLAMLALEQGKTASPNTSAYCQARARLPQPLLEQSNAGVLERIQSSEQPARSWYGRTVKVVDGSSLSMADTEDNQRLYPQPKPQKPGCGFPVMRMVAVFSLSTGALLGLAKDALSVGERALFRRLGELFLPSDVVLSDRGFSSYADQCSLTERGVDYVMRKHQRRSTGVKRVRQLEKGDRIVQWFKTTVCPKWLDTETWNQMPETLTVREITFTVGVSGFRSETITVVTSLLDPCLFPQEAFAQLYRRRWMAELFLRDIKTTLGMDVLRCKTPKMIHKELQMYLLAYNLIRALMGEAAQKHGVCLYRISFKGTLGTVRTWAPLIANTQLSQIQQQHLLEIMLHYLAADLLPLRPNRTEPRARKRRPKNYPLLTKPRQQFIDIPHRNRYKKSLT